MSDVKDTYMLIDILILRDDNFLLKCDRCSLDIAKILSNFNFWIFVMVFPLSGTQLVCSWIRYWSGN